MGVQEASASGERGRLVIGWLCKGSSQRGFPSSATYLGPGNSSETDPIALISERSKQRLGAGQ